MALLALGSNGSGQLGIGHQDDVSSPIRTTMPSTAPSKPPVKIAAGGNHTLVHYASGEVYATGANDNGRCGAICPESSVTFIRVPIASEPDAIVSDRFLFCTALWEASIFIAPDQSLYACGSGSKGELGLGPGVTHAKTPQPISRFFPEDVRIVQLESCVAHNIVVLSDGSVYGWGNGRKGQLGEPAGVVWSPRRIQGVDFKVHRGACGRDFTYLAGDPDKGLYTVLGSDKWGSISKSPPNICGWSDIGASWGSLFALTSSGSLLSWGRNDHGQLAPDGLPQVKRIAVGSEHVLVLTDSGMVLAWGWGEHGNCGSAVDDAGDIKGRWNELSPGDPSGHLDTFVHSIGAGCASSWISVADSATN